MGPTRDLRSVVKLDLKPHGARFMDASDMTYTKETLICIGMVTYPKHPRTLKKIYI